MSGTNYRQIRRSAGRSSKSWRLKKVLATMIAIGAFSFLTVGGTYAVLNSQEANKGSKISTGTLTFTNQVNTGTVCQSYGSGSVVNVNSACTALVTSATLNYPGVLLTENVTIANNGSLPAADLSVFMPSCTAGLSPSTPTNPNWGSITLSSALSTSSPITTMAVTALGDAVTSGDSIVLTSGANTQTFVASANALAGATSISVTSQTPNFAYPTTSTVTDTGIAIHLSSTLSTAAPITSLPVTALGEAVASGDTIVLTSGTNTQTFLASANAIVGATSIAVSSQTPNFAYPTSSTVNDVSPDTFCPYPDGANTTCTVADDTLYAFAANYNSSASALDLGTGPAAAAKSYFVIGMELPTNASNTLQGESAAFPLTWHMTT